MGAELFPADVARRSVGWAAAWPPLARGATGRGIREGDLVGAILAPVLFFLCFHLPLHESMPDYADFLLPVVLVQSAIFAAILAAQNAGSDAGAAVQDRLLSLPIPRLAPAVGRLSAMGLRAAVSVASGLGLATLFGFGFEGGAGATAAFLLTPVLLALVLSMLTDALGQVVRDRDTVGQFLMIPQLLLVMMSTGVVPEAGFPEWIRPFVRNQPVSQYVAVMRGWRAGDPVEPLPAVLWTLALAAAGVAALVAAGRREARR